ncbi:MAG: 1-phosphofructokinase family hexose kinase [Clostridiales bacterium]|nr:1-phosphofructokinase family hexose kinase [Clostridiales bacterium]
MITALLLNPCIDRTVYIDGFFYGEMNRISEVVNVPAGKGAQVALALFKLGVKSSLVSFGAKGEDPVKKRMESFGIPCDIIDAFDSIRVNTKLNNTQDNVVTEINEKGPQVTSEQIEGIIKLCVSRAKQSDFFVLTGSMPKGCDSSLYGEIMAKIKMTAPECKLVLDAEGDVFKKALQQKPYIIKPNKYEMEIYCGKKFNSLEEIAEEGMKLHKKGIAYVIISMGAEGAILCCDKGSYHAAVPKVKVINTVGAGDSMLSATMIAVDQGLMGEDVLKYAVAAGSAAASCSNNVLIDKDIFDDLKENIDTREIDAI